MGQKIQSIRGMSDCLPDQIGKWQHVERCLINMASRYGYTEIRLPMVEYTSLFSRTIGDHTDVVNKEMYSFADSHGDSLSLRPEGTAGCMRAVIEHDMTYGQVQRLYYMGPMFRYERPQKGRSRQFHHFGLEAVGMAGHVVEAELIQLMTAVWQQLGVEKKLTLQLNSLGTPAVRACHKKSLVAYFTQHQAQLDADSLTRLQSNPLRILDSKNPAMQALIEAAPRLADFYDQESTDHFRNLCALLDELGIAYSVNPRLVRGLDYYGHTVFEWVADALAAQGTVCGGGRYDGLIEQLGGRSTPAVGLAMGIERLLLLCDDEPKPPSVDVYAVYEPAATASIFSLAQAIRQQYPHLSVVLNATGGSFKSQFKQAGRSGATVVMVMGEAELAQQQVMVKWMNTDKPQQAYSHDLLVQKMDSIMNENKRGV